MMSETRIYQKERQRMPKWPPIILLFVFVLVYGWNGITVRHWSSTGVRIFATIIPLPAATVNGAVITYHELLKRQDVLVWLKGEQANREELLGAALEALIRQEAMEQIAEDIGLAISKEQLEQARGQVIGEMTDEAFKEKIKSELNMNETVFTETVLRPLALAQALESAVWSSEALQSEERSMIDQAQGELIAGVSFSDVAQKYSDDPSAGSGGDLGYLTAVTLPPGWEALLSLAEGQTTGVMETERAFVIAKVAWLAGEEDDTQIRTQAIIVDKKSLDEVIDAFLFKSRVRVIIEQN